MAYFLYLQVEAYLISPRIMARAVSVPAGVAIISVAAGGALWGVLGARCHSGESFHAVLVRECSFLAKTSYSHRPAVVTSGCKQL